jgi:Polyketide cyclase / dehydrase and lipid transport
MLKVSASELVPLPPGPAREGSTYDEVNPIAGPWKARTSWRVTEFTPPRRQVHWSTDVPLTSSFDVIMEVEPEGEATLVTLTLQGAPSSGPVGAAFARLMRGSVARDNRRSLENLAELAGR